jgi:hypothetical protein
MERSNGVTEKRSYFSEEDEEENMWKRSKSKLEEEEEDDVSIEEFNKFFSLHLKLTSCAEEAQVKETSIRFSNR